MASLVAAAPDFDRMLQLAGQRFGAKGRQGVESWRQMLSEAGKSVEIDRVGVVNDFFNQHIRFVEDAETWNLPDYWATPVETLGRGQGDCEDFTIAKYLSLKLLGVATEKLRLTYVKARIGGRHSRISRAHMVLSYYPAPASEPLILDNLISDIRPASQRPDLFPVFSFSSENLWAGGNPTPVASATSRLSRWRDVLSRVQSEMGDGPMLKRPLPGLAEAGSQVFK
ncbi:MAG: transglutaminase-like cysteine peptidase [Syntrophotaleaceae bacterium]